MHYSFPRFLQLIYAEYNKVFKDVISVHSKINARKVYDLDNFPYLVLKICVWELVIWLFDLLYTYRPRHFLSVGKLRLHSLIWKENLKLHLLSYWFTNCSFYSLIYLKLKFWKHLNSSNHVTHIYNVFELETLSFLSFWTFCRNINFWLDISNTLGF